eukprot:COSAG01_NODE_7819_length_3043_cov_2.192595_3_plen_380_part_01
MMPLFALASILMTADAVTGLPTSEQIHISNLRCEHLTNPEGLDTPHPRFAWEMSASAARHRGLKQISYRLVVHEAGAENRLAVWDSQATESSSSFNVKYAGAALRSTTRYTWFVQVGMKWEGTAEVSMVTSAWATFSTGMLVRDDWTGKFIGMGGTGQECPWFRRKFHLSESEMALLRSSGGSAQLMVASVGYCETTVNGNAATEGVLLPSVSYLPKRVLYRTYNVSGLLHAGDNAIGLWASAGWAKYKSMPPLYSNAPLVMAELHVNGGVKVVTDQTWKMHNSTVTNILHYGDGGFGGDSLDDSKAVDGWDTAVLDDSSWSSARVFECDSFRSFPQAAAPCPPLANVTISADVMEPTVKLRRYRAVKVSTVAAGGDRGV